jgi:hypothetical protein
MKLKRSSVTVAAGVATLAAVMVSPPAFATAYPVAVAGWTGPVIHTLGASTLAGPTFVTPYSSLSCTSSTTVVGTATVMSGTLVDSVFTLSNVPFRGCTSAALAWTVKLSGSFVVDSGATGSTSDILVGRLTNVSLQFATSVPSVCSLVVSGEADATYNEAIGLLTVNETGLTGDLAVASSSGSSCAGMPGYPTDFEATYVIAAVDSTPFTTGMINVG